MDAKVGSQAHKFAFFFQNIDQIRTSGVIEIDDPEIVYRLFGIVRKRAGQEIILFNDHVHATAIIVDCNKRSAKLEIYKPEANKIINPSILVCVGLTKKPAFEEIVYTSSALGVQAILPILSRQIERNWLFEHELSRLERISVAAREQSKSFCKTQILAPIELAKLGNVLDELVDAQSPRVLFEAGQSSFSQLSESLSNSKPEKLTILFGPEGGFLDEEIEQIQKFDFKVYSLTQTVLRSQDATVVGIGALRSLLS